MSFLFLNKGNFKNYNLRKAATKLGFCSCVMMLHLRLRHQQTSTFVAVYISLSFYTSRPYKVLRFTCYLVSFASKTSPSCLDKQHPKGYGRQHLKGASCLDKQHLEG